MRKEKKARRKHKHLGNVANQEKKRGKREDEEINTQQERRRRKSAGNVRLCVL